MSFTSSRLGRTLLVALLAAAPVAGHAAASDDVLPLFRFDPQVPELPADGTPAFETTVVLDGRPTVVSLELYSVRSAGFRLMVQDATGEHEVAPPPPRTYRGAVVGLADSHVAATVVDGRLTAVIAMPDGTVYGVQPASELLPGAVDAMHFSFDTADVAPDGGTCSADDLDPIFNDPPPLVPADDGDPLGQAGEKIAQLAFDTDVEFYQQNGSSVAATVYDIEKIVNAVGVIYRRDVDIEHFINFLLVRTASDPYDQNDADDRLCTFRTIWNVAYTHVTRDTAHLMTGRDLTGSTIGLAWRAVLCNRVGLADNPCNTEGNLAYGLSQSTSAVFANRVALTAHELGHNWGATHCDGDNDCGIMCASLGGCAGPLDEFGAAATIEITLHRVTRGCLITCFGAIAVPAQTSTVRGGVYRVCWGGDVIIAAGSYNETIRINKACTLTAAGGTVVIGD